MRLCAEPVYEPVCRVCVPSFVPNLCSVPVYLAAASVRANRPHFTDNQNMRCSRAALSFFPFLSRACTWFRCRRGCRFRYGCRYRRCRAAFYPPPLFINSTQVRRGDPGEQEPGLLPSVLHSPVVRDSGAGIADTVPCHRELLVSAHVALPVRVSVLGVWTEKGGWGGGRDPAAAESGMTVKLPFLWSSMLWIPLVCCGASFMLCNPVARRFRERVDGETNSCLTFHGWL